MLLPDQITRDGNPATGTNANLWVGQQINLTNIISGPDVMLPLDLQIPQAADSKALKSLYAVAGRKNDGGEIMIKVIDVSDQPQRTTIQLKGEFFGLNAGTTVLTSEKPGDENSFESRP